VDGFKERVAALRAEGLSAADAFREAFLAQAEDQLERVGSVADTTLGAFKRLEAQLKNISDATKEFAGKALLPVIAPFVAILEATETLNTALELGVITQEQYAKAIDRHTFQSLLSAGSAMRSAAGIQEEYGAAIEAVLALEEAAAEATAEWNRRLEEQAERLTAVGQIQPTLAVKMELETENVFDKVREQLGMLERGAGELALVAEILPEVDWGLVDPRIRDMILGQGEALSMLVSADIEGMTPEQQEKLRTQIAEATDIPPEHVDILWRNFQERGNSAVQEWVTSTLGLLRGTVSPAMQAAVDPLISGVGRFTRSLDALDGRRIKIYVDYIATGDVPAGGGGGQHGLHFLVGGLPGPDRNLVTLRLTRGEEVSVKPRSGSPQQGSAAMISDGPMTKNFMPGMVVNINNTVDTLAFDALIRSWMGG
jgi:hypothetical protein